MPKPRGFLTQCQGAGHGTNYGNCATTIRLEKPGKWRCPKCEKKFGALISDPRPTAPL